MAGYGHLHVRSGFSWGFGTATPEELVERTAGLGMETLALTDRDTLAGIPRLLHACESTGVSPIVGSEVTVEAMGVRGHVVLLADGIEGYRSLCKLITSYRLTAEDRNNPVCPLPLLLEHGEGLVCLTGAVPYGLLPSMLLSPDTMISRGTRRLVSMLRDAFGSYLYVEISDDRTEGSRRRIARVAGFALEAGLPLVATNEVAYLYPADHRLHDVLVAAANLTAMPGPGYRPTDRLHLTSREEMRRLFADRPEALRNTAEIAERCAGALRLDGRVHMPAANLSPGEDADRKLFALTVRGARQKYGKLDKQVVSRLRREISCIEDLRFAPYFLIAREAVGIAQDKGIPVTGRGSSANSIVAYCLGLTQPEPLENDLLFERFLHEHRRDAPDVDLDFCSRRRDEVRDELMRRYAHSGTSVVATASKMSLRGAVRVVARALGRTPREIDDLARHVPSRIKDRDQELHPVAAWDQALAEPAILDTLTPLIDEVEEELLGLSVSEPWAGQVPFVVQLPGMGAINAMILLSAIGDISRFPSSKHLVGYSGLGAEVHSSGQTYRTGRITKQGRRELRTALVEAAWVAVREHPHWKEQFGHLSYRIGKSKAIVAIARKLLVTLWHVLTKREADRNANPVAVARKLMRWGVHRGIAVSQGLSRAAFVKKYLTILGLGEELSSFSYGSKRVLLNPTVGERRLPATSGVTVA